MPRRPPLLMRSRRTRQCTQCLRARTLRNGERSADLTGTGKRLILRVFARPGHGTGVEVTARR